MRTNELIYKTETGSQTLKTNTVIKGRMTGKDKQGVLDEQIHTLYETDKQQGPTVLTSQETVFNIL